MNLKARLKNFNVLKMRTEWTYTLRHVSDKND
jgi:hypothetical protein